MPLSTYEGTKMRQWFMKIQRKGVTYHDTVNAENFWQARARLELFYGVDAIYSVENTIQIPSHSAEI